MLRIAVEFSAFQLFQRPEPIPFDMAGTRKSASLGDASLVGIAKTLSTEEERQGASGRGFVHDNRCCGKVSEFRTRDESLPDGGDAPGDFAARQRQKADLLRPPLIFPAGDFVGDNVEAGQPGVSELRRYRHVRRIATAGDDDTSDARDVVPGIKSEPAPVQKHLEPGTEIHRRGVFGDADISEIARAVACRNVHAAAQRDCKMREIAANTNTLSVALRCGSVPPRMLTA